MLRVLVLLALTCALALGGCGGSDPESATTASEPTTAAAPKAQTQTQAPKPEAPNNSAAKQTTPHNAPGSAGNPTPGTKAPAPGVPIIPEGDNSVQTFGTEGQETEREQAEADLNAYLTARARGDWAGACKAASEQFAEELAKLIEQAKAKPGAEKPAGCAATLEALSGGDAANTEAMRPERVLSFRIREDGYAYLIYEDPEGAVKFIAMANDNGTWKVNVPEPASFQASQGEPQ